MPAALTHAYVASRFNKNPLCSLGSVYPDLMLFFTRDIKHDLISPFNAILKTKGVDENFLQGMELHRDLDNILHPEYVYEKVAILQKEFPTVSESLIHGLLEIAMDAEIYSKFPYVKDELKKAVKSINLDFMTKDLAEFLQVPYEEAVQVIKDCGFLMSFVNLHPRSIIHLFIEGFVLRKYKKSLNYSNFSLLESRRILIKAKEIVKEDFIVKLTEAITRLQETKQLPLEVPIRNL